MGKLFIAMMPDGSERLAAGMAIGLTRPDEIHLADTKSGKRTAVIVP